MRPLENLFDRDGLERIRKSHRVDPHQMRLFRNDRCKRFCKDTDINTKFPFSSGVRSPSLEIRERCESQLDGATKLLMQTSTGRLIETVILRIATGRTTLCLSSQIGCAAACDFCATGKMGIAQNLSASEILDQVLLAGQMLANENRTIQNIVFMGMGEPFHNEPALFESLAILTSSDYFAISPSRILVSSVGVADGMIRCAERFPNIKQAISLHSVRQDVRERLIPLARRFPLATLRTCMKSLNQLQDSPVLVEYLMLAGINDSLEDADELAQWLHGKDVHINLIPFNQIDDAPHLTSSPSATIQRFSKRLKLAGHRVTTRYSLGRDIARGVWSTGAARKPAACNLAARRSLTFEPVAQSSTRAFRGAWPQFREERISPACRRRPAARSA